MVGGNRDTDVPVLLEAPHFVVKQRQSLVLQDRQRIGFGKVLDKGAQIVAQLSQVETLASEELRTTMEEPGNYPPARLRWQRRPCDSSNRNRILTWNESKPMYRKQESLRLP